MAKSVGIEDIRLSPFILDIDLDYFRTIAALSPQDPTIFYELVNKAVAITIATEPSFVERLKLDSQLTSSYALQKVIEHIKIACYSLLQ